MTNQQALLVPRDAILALIDRQPDLAPTTKKQYIRAVTNYLDAGHSLGNTEALATYAAGISPSSRAFLKAGIRLWTEHVATKAKAGATPENVDAVQATLYRLDALSEAIKVGAAQGRQTSIWLSQTEVRQLLASCNTNTIQGKRDRVVLSLLVSAGLRRDELKSLDFDHIQIQSLEKRRRTMLAIHGKGAKARTVPISDELADLLGHWHEIVGSGHVVRSLTRGGQLGQSISTVGIFHIVRAAGDSIGRPKLAPHDLRRTYAQLGYEAGVPITQISTFLGHASVATTQRYLNLSLDLDTTVSDFIPILGF